MSREPEGFKEWYASINEGNSFGNQRTDTLTGYIQGRRECEEVKAELEQCLSAHSMLNDKVCAMEAENVTLEEQLLQMHEGLTLAETEINELKIKAGLE